VTREAWTDERLDDLAATLRPLPLQVARLTEAVERLTEEMRTMRQDLVGLRGEVAEVRTQLAATQRQIAQIGWGCAAALLTAMIALLVAVL
jgi:chromosome segregation ATPase